MPSMRPRLFFGGLLLLEAAILCSPNPGRAQTAASMALTGQVSSQEEGSMEGVLVSAKRTGSTITITVVSDRIVRVDSKSGQITEYLLPQETNVRRVFVDSSTTPVTFWVGNNHHASVVKLEPLD